MFLEDIESGSLIPETFLMVPDPVLESVMCNGRELNLIDCPALIPQNSSCQTIGYAGVICQG